MLEESATVKELQQKIQELKAMIKKDKLQKERQSTEYKKIGKGIKRKSKIVKTDSKESDRSKRQAQMQKECRRNIASSSSSSEDESVPTMSCDDNELDDIDPKNFCNVKRAVRREESGSKDTCLIRG